MRSLNLRSIERRSFRAILSGGLIEMMFGSASSYALSDAGASSVGSSCALIAGCALGLLGTSVFRRDYVIPRVGRVVFSPRRDQRVRRMRVLLAVSVAVTVGLVVITALGLHVRSPASRSISGHHVAAIISAVVVLPLAALSFFLDSARFVLLGALIAMAEFALTTFDRYGGPPHDRVIVYALLGTIAFAIGVLSFVRVVRRVSRRVIGEEVSADER